MKRKLKRIGYLVLILVVIVFIFENRQEWKVEILFLGGYRMPAWSMIILLMGLGFLIGFLTPIWLRKRRESQATSV
ncbi:MAG: hypothetical protein V3U11_05490 [Planctomycetota bacterium]